MVDLIREEVQKAIRKIKNKIAIEPDGTPEEIQKVLKILDMADKIV